MSLGRFFNLSVGKKLSVAERVDFIEVLIAIAGIAQKRLATQKAERCATLGACHFVAAGAPLNRRVALGA